MKRKSIFTKYSLPILLCFSVCHVTLSAQALEKRAITPYDIWAVKRVDNPQVSPNQKQVAFTVQEYSVDKNRPTTHIWLMDVDGKNQRRLTNGDNNDSAHVWSPDGSRLAFISKRASDESPSLYVLRLDGGEPEKILEMPYGVSQAKWMPDGASIVVNTSVIPHLVGKYSATDLAAMKKEIKRRKESKMTARVSEDRQFRFFDKWLTDNLAQRLLRVKLADKSFIDLTPFSQQLFNAGGSASFDISPDGKKIALSFNTTPAPHQEHNNDDIFFIATDGSGIIKNITLDNPASDNEPRFSPDGSQLYYSKMTTNIYDGSFNKIWKHQLSTGVNSPVTDAEDYAIAEVEFSKKGDQLWMTAENKGAKSIFKSTANGKDFSVVFNQGSSSNVKVVGSQLIFLNNTQSKPNELYAFDIATKKIKQLTSFNDELMAQLNLGKVESYTFAGGNNEQVHGWLILPPNYDEKKTYPLLQLMHGGPHTMVGDAWSSRWNGHVFASPGYIVTWVNRHGSSGFGEKFSQSIKNQWGVLPTQDILKSTDYLTQRFPNIDKKRIAAAGASYGGYMAAWLAGHTDRFATIVNHAGVNDLVAQYGADVTSYSFSEVLGGTPWENNEGMQKNNPMTYAKNFKTPMLLTHGELDYRVPYVHSTALYGILQAMKVPSRLVIFPNENHWILSPQNSIYWNWEVQNWLSRYIGGEPSLQAPVFNKE